MKHLKIFEKRSGVKDFFKDKINWKFFNKVKDELTFFEDLSIDAGIEVIVYNEVKNEDTIINSSNIYYYVNMIDEQNEKYEDEKFVEPFTDEKTNETIEKYKANGINYLIWVDKRDNVNLNILKKRISKYIEIVNLDIYDEGYDFDNNYMIVKPR